MLRDWIELARAVVVEDVPLVDGQDDPVSAHPKRKRVVNVKRELRECKNEQRLNGEDLREPHRGHCNLVY